MRYQKNYDKKVKLTRILLSDYLLLKELSNTTGLSMSAVLHELITGQDHKVPVSPAQIRMPVNMARSTPVTTKLMPSAIKSTPVTIARRRSTPVTLSFAREVKPNDFGQNGH